MKDAIEAIEVLQEVFQKIWDGDGWQDVVVEAMKETIAIKQAVEKKQRERNSDGPQIHNDN